MSITKIDSLLIDNPDGSLRNLELWWGDVSNITATNSTDFLAVSLLPKSTTFCANSVGGALQARGLHIGSLGIDKDYTPSMPISISKSISSIPGIAYKRILFFQPEISGMTTAQAAPYQCDFIFRALDCFQKGAATSVTLPLVSCGTLTGAGQANPSTILRMLFHSACKWGGKADFRLHTVRIVIHSNNATLAKEFAEMKSNYLNLLNNTAYPVMPNSYGAPYSYYADNTNTWISINKGSGWPNKMSDAQVFGIHMYTTSYFHAMNDNLRKIDKKLPSPGGIGYTDVNNPYFKQLQPLLAVTSAGLLNLPPFSGNTYRGINRPLWNPFKMGSTLRILSYMSSSSPITPVTKAHDVIITSISVNSRDIHYYSKNPPEKEHTYDYGTQEKVNSALPVSMPSQIGVNEIDHHYCK
ncbi:hypothetical protein [Ascidiimonas sp. W6]|uniref:hypothetical protein n=1 Tax=Ascidiimonas meishanensis TaxID=3128903 RepID=UPI0030EF8888